MIEVQNLVKYYGDLRALDNVSFSVERGEILGFLGPNAAGKTTTMRIITGFLPASHGTVKVGGFDVFQEGLKVKRQIGYLPENPPLYNDMRVSDYLRFAGTIKGIDRRHLKAEIERVADVLSITKVLPDLIGKLSRGYRQRVGFAQALLNNPSVLILDEPTVGLDPKQIIEVRELIKTLGHEHTIILSTHILPEVSMTCNRVIIINEGRLVAVDSPANLTAKLKGSDSILIEAEGPPDEIRNALEKLDNVLSVSIDAGSDAQRHRYKVETRLGADIRKNIAATIVRQGWGLTELRAEGLSLEDVFLRLTTREEGPES